MLLWNSKKEHQLLADPCPQTTYDIKKIRQVAEALREEWFSDEDSDGPTGMCLTASEELATRLRRIGYPARVVMGRLEIDFPNWEHYTEWDPADFNSEEEMNEAMHTPLHYWVEIGDLIIDITADQFNDELDSDVLEPVMVGSYNDDRLWRYLRKGSRAP
jgi:hypothetical protein